MKHTSEISIEKIGFKTWQIDTSMNSWKCQFMYEKRIYTVDSVTAESPEDLTKMQILRIVLDDYLLGNKDYRTFMEITGYTPETGAKEAWNRCQIVAGDITRLFRYHFHYEIVELYDRVLKIEGFEADRDVDKIFEKPQPTKPQ